MITDIQSDMPGIWVEDLLKEEIKPYTSKLVKYRKTQRTLDVNLGYGYPYQIDLDSCRNSAELLDWIVQISMKNGCTPQHIYDIIHVLNSVCYEVFNTTIQGTFCPCGNNNNTVDWERKTINGEKKK